MDPGGTLDDYVPFYFTPFSPMLYNIKTGYNGITRRENDEIAIVASSLHRLLELNVPFVFSDRHAYLRTARMSSDLVQLDRIDWTILQNRDFKRDADDPEKVERYQAEALIFRQCPPEAIIGLACHSEKAHKALESDVNDSGLQINLWIKPGWYF